MKLYDFELAPSPKRVRMFLAEKGVDVPAVRVDVRERAQFADSYKRINPFSVVPALELDDGTVICESVAICRYFEETRPDPPLFGVGALERARVEMWSRRAEINGYLPVADVLRNRAAMFEGRGLPGVPGGVPQIPELATRGRAAFERFLRLLDPHLAGSEYLVGERFSIADITCFVALWFGARGKMGVPEDCAHVRRWFEAASARPSAEA